MIFNVKSKFEDDHLDYIRHYSKQLRGLERSEIKSEIMAKGYSDVYHGNTIFNNYCSDFHESNVIFPFYKFINYNIFISGLTAKLILYLIVIFYNLYYFLGKLTKKNIMYKMKWEAVHKNKISSHIHDDALGSKIIFSSNIEHENHLLLNNKSKFCIKGFIHELGNDPFGYILISQLQVY